MYRNIQKSTQTLKIILYDLKKAHGKQTGWELRSKDRGTVVSHCL